MKQLLTTVLILIMMTIFLSQLEHKNVEIDSQVAESEEEIVEPTEEVVVEDEIYWVLGATVNFREAPNMKCEIISVLTRGTEVVKLGEEGNWIYVRYGENTGYLYKSYLSKYKPYDPENGEVSIVVKKGERILELWQGGEIVDTFSIGLGGTPVGHKQVQGDGKTPEGDYYVCVRNTASSYYLSLGVSYPNKEDAKAALADGRIDRDTYYRIAGAIESGECPDWNTALGGAIMIHGWGGSSDWTAGCIAVDNEVMDILFDYCALRTKIKILP